MSFSSFIYGVNCFAVCLVVSFLMILVIYVDIIKSVPNSLDFAGELRMKLSLAKVQYSTLSLYLKVYIPVSVHILLAA